MSLFAAHPVLFTVGNFPITAHGLLFAGGGEVALLLLLFLAGRLGLPARNLAEKVLVIFVAGLVGGRLGFFLTYPGQYVSFAQALAIWNGGLLSYGAILAGLGAAVLLFFREQGGLLRWLDLAGVTGLAGWAVGRLGNYWAADSWGVLNPHFKLFYGRVPIQLMEAVLCGCAAAFLASRLLRGAKPGLVLGLALTSYGLIRLFVDTWRDEAVLTNGLHPGQMAGLIMALIAVVYLGIWHARQ